MAKEDAQDNIKAPAQSVKEIKKETKAELNSESNEKNILEMSKISLGIDTYDDIFSDFDPRPFTKRSVSVDFLDEIKRASREKVSGQIEINFLVPSKIRSIETEIQIKRRLKEHFKKHSDLLKKETKKTTYTGISIAAFGFIFMFIGVLFHYILGERVLTDILVTLFEPLGWFMMFYGFDTAFYSLRQKKPEVDFYEKMSKADISFMSY